MNKIPDVRLGDREGFHPTPFICFTRAVHRFELVCFSSHAVEVLRLLFRRLFPSADESIVVILCLELIRYEVYRKFREVIRFHYSAARLLQRVTVMGRIGDGRVSRDRNCRGGG